MRRLTALCAAMAVLLGCGGGDDGPVRKVRVAAGEPIRLTADEYRFDPGEVTVAGSGGRIPIILANRGTLAHNVRVFDGDRELGGLPSFPPGEELRTVVPVPPGTYRLVCTVADHAEKGMTGELVVGG